MLLSCISLSSSMTACINFSHLVAKHFKIKKLLTAFFSQCLETNQAKSTTWLHREKSSFRKLMKNDFGLILFCLACNLRNSYSLYEVRLYPRFTISLHCCKWLHRAEENQVTLRRSKWPHKLPCCKLCVTETAFWLCFVVPSSQRCPVVL